MPRVPVLGHTSTALQRVCVCVHDVHDVHEGVLFVRLPCAYVCTLVKCQCVRPARDRQPELRREPAILALGLIARHQQSKQANARGPESRERLSCLAPTTAACSNSFARSPKHMVTLADDIDDDRPACRTLQSNAPRTSNFNARASHRVRRAV